MNHVLRDVRFAFRSLLRNRSVTIVSVLTLALALGANTAIFSVIDALLLRPLPFSTADQLVTVHGYNSVHGTHADAAELSWPNAEDIGKQSKTLAKVSAFFLSSAFIYTGDEPTRVWGANVGHEMFDVLAIKPELGHAFTAAEDSPDAPLVVALSHEAWQREFGGDPHIIGRQIRFGSGGRTRTVVAVLPPMTRFPIDPESPRVHQEVDYWLPIVPDLGDNRTERGAIFLDCVGLLKPGVTLQQAQADATSIALRLERLYPDSNTHFRIAIDSLQELLTRPFRPALFLLLVAVGVVLLIGCANVANLLLARGAGRQREIAIRAALGASRGRIVAQLLVESVVLAFLAGTLGLLLASWGIDLLVAAAPHDIPRLDTVSIDGPVLLFATLLSLATGIIFGLAPALSASKTNLTESLNDASRGSTEGRRGGRLRKAIVVTEIALALALLAAAGLLLRSFVRLLGTDPGFDFRSTTVVALSPRASAYKDDASILAFQKRLMDEARSIPGITALAGANMLPLGGSETVFTFSIVGHPPFPAGEHPVATIVSVTPGYFHTMRMPIVGGRDFDNHDQKNSELVIAVDETFARRFFPDRSAVGQQIFLSDGKPRRIVGVVGAVHFVALSEAPRSTFYFPETQETGRRFNLVIRTGNSAPTPATLRALVHRVDSQQPILAITTLGEMRGETLARRKFTVTLLGLLATLALLLSAVGIYSIMSYSVAQRTSEIGIRMALGAESHDVIRLVLGDALRMTAIGVAAGLTISLASTRVIRSLLYGVAPTDPLTLVAISVILGSIATLASYVPARRAARVDPLVAIRCD